MSAPSARALRRPSGSAVDRLYDGGRSGGAIIAAVAVFVLFQSFFWASHVPLTLKIGALAVALISAWRPADGLLVVAGLTPFGLMLTSRVFSANPGRITEAIVMAFLAGYAVRAVTDRLVRRGQARDDGSAADRRGVPAQLLVPAVLFCVVTLASCVVHYGFVQVWHDRPRLFFVRFVEFVVLGYHGDRGNYDPLAADAGFRFFAFGLFTIQSVALCFIACHLCLKTPAVVPRLLRMVVAGAVGAAVLSFVALAQAAAAAPDLMAAWPALLEQRWTMFTPKLNTAASLFVLAAPIALGVGATAGHRRLGWMASAVVLIGALWINGTRVALIAAVIVLGAIALWSVMQRRGGLTRIGLPVAVGLLVLTLGVAGMAFQRVYSVAEAIPAAESLGYRYEFNKTALLMFASSPVFGVGIDQFYLQSETFGSPDLPDQYRRVPAHNPFLQTAGELGLAGLIPFVWMLGAAAWLGRLALRERPDDKILLGVAAGLVTFLLTTASSGHPLLIEVTAYTFWVVLGLGVARACAAPAVERPKYKDEAGPSHAPARAMPPWARQVLVFSSVVLAVSVPVRWIEARRDVDYTQITYGLHDWEQAGGARYRWTSDRATMFLGPEATWIELPIRAPLVDTTGPMHVEVLVDGRLANRIDLEHSDWRPIRLELPPSTQRYRVLELQVSPSWFPAELLPGSTDPRELGVMVGEMRNWIAGTATAGVEPEE